MFLSVVDPRTGTMRFHDLFRELMEIELGSRDPSSGCGCTGAPRCCGGPGVT